MSRGGVILTLLLLPLAALLGAWWALDDDVFTPLRLSGGPLLVAEGDRPALLVLTVHGETSAFTPSLIAWQPRGKVHVDLFAFAAADMKQLWVRRVATLPPAAQPPQAAILGATASDVRVSVNGTAHAFALADGAGTEPRGAPTIRPMRLATDGATAFRVRGTILSGMWYGMVHPDERAALEREMTEQPADRALDYRLWTARASERYNFVFNSLEYRIHDFNQAPSGPAFRRGGLLTRETTHSTGDPTAANRRAVIVLTDAPRLVVLHDREDAGETWRYLTCLRLDGGVCWDVELRMTRLLAVATVFEGSPDDHAIIVVGDRKRPGEGEDQATQIIMNVGTREGTARAVNLDAIDLHALKAGLAR